MPSNSFIELKLHSDLRRLLKTIGIFALLCGILAIPLPAQVNVLTQHNDNMRSGAITNETILTPTNVSTATFGVIASRAVDGLVAAQPLYVSNVNIPGLGLHNVVYVATLHDSVYAFDADNYSGSNANPLWQVSFLNPAAGITTEPPAELGCISTTFNTEMGILGTPTIDSGSSTIYVLAKTKENGTYHFRLHALDLGTGFEKFGGPVDVNGTVTGKIGTLSLITAGKNMMARPALLLSQGIVYLAFGSNGCDGGGTRGWVVAYSAGSLMQLGIFNTAPDTTIAHGNIWQAGSGLATDDNGNIFFSTANGPFDANIGSTDYGSSVLRIGWGASGLGVLDYFTPFDQALLTGQDLDLSSAGVTMLPVQPGIHPHLLVASGKTGDVYVIDRDNMGHYNSVDNSQIPQYMPTGVGRMFSTAASWNGSVYFTGEDDGVTKFSLVNGQLSLAGKNTTVLCCAHTPSISANGNSNGILWVANGNGFSAFNASDMTQPPLYNLAKLGTLAHFNTPTIANGKVFVGTNLSLQVLGLLGNLQATSGNNQTVPSLGTAPLPLQVTANDAYTGAPVAGVTVTFKDGGKGGVFSPSAGVVVTDASGRASVSYTVPKLAGAYTITANYPASTTAKFTVTVVGGAPTHIAVISGNKQTGAQLTAFPQPLVVQLDDVSNNGVPGGTVTFPAASASGSFSPLTVVTDSKGRAQSFYTSGTKSGAIAITITSGALHQGMSETVLPGAPTAITLVSGNSQKAAASTTLATKLTAKVVDQYNNGIPGLSVTFSDGGVGGVITTSPVVTDAQGRAIVSYTLPATPQVVHVTASVSGVGSVTFTETAQ
jgi:hypothetical protein